MGEKKKKQKGLRERDRVRRGYDSRTSKAAQCLEVY
jgi:hypothetical protein